MRFRTLIAAGLIFFASHDSLFAGPGDLAGTVGTVYLHPTGMTGQRAAADPSQPWDMGGNVWWKHDWEAFDVAKTRDLALIRSNFGEHPRTLVMVYFPIYLADTMYGTTYLERLQAVVDYFATNGLEVMLFFGRPDVYGDGTWAQSHDPVSDLTARDYMLANIDRTLRFGSIPQQVHLVTVYYLGWSSLCPKTESDIHAYNVAIRQAINAAGMQFIHHVDGPFWEHQNTDGQNTWTQCGYTPYSIAASSGASDGLFGESWAQGSLVPGVQRLLSEGRFTTSQILLMNDVPNCDDPSIAPTNPCATGALGTDDATWFDWIQYLGLPSWSVWSFCDGALQDRNEYGDVKNDGSGLTPKGALHRAEALRWKGEPPSTSVGAPANDSMLSGAVLITATASDDVAVTSLEIRIDDVVKTSAADVTALQYEWDTTDDAEGAHVITSVASDAVGHVVASSAVTVTVVHPIAAPAALSATAAGSQITLAWNTVSGAATFTVYRSANGSPFEPVSSSGVTSYIDTSVLAGTTYLYQVRAVTGDGAHGPASALDYATIVSFEDEPIIGGTTRIKAQHITELRNAVNAVRAAAGLGAVSFSNAVAPGGLVRTADVSELRAAINEARAALGLPPLTYADVSLSGTSIRAVHLGEIRAAVR